MAIVQKRKEADVLMVQALDQSHAARLYSMDQAIPGPYTDPYTDPYLISVVYGMG